MLVPERSVLLGLTVAPGPSGVAESGALTSFLRPSIWTSTTASDKDVVRNTTILRVWRDASSHDFSRRHDCTAIASPATRYRTSGARMEGDPAYTTIPILATTQLPRKSHTLQTTDTTTYTTILNLLSSP